MKKSLYAAIGIILIFLVSGFVYALIERKQTLSSSQREIIEAFGYPQRFSIAYVPRGEGDDLQLVRKEEWFYPLHQKTITFLAGEILSLDALDEDEGLTYVSLKPEDFVFDMDYGEVDAKIDPPIEKADMVPELFKAGEIETYVSDHVIFTIESGRLTYFETIGLKEK